MSDLVPVGNPSTSELDAIMRQAEVLAVSTIVPRDYQKQPGNILAAALMGRSFGWDAMTSMRLLTVIQGTASLKPEAMLALIRQRGHSVRIEIHADGQGATAHGKRADTGDTASATFTVADAERAGLLRNGTWKAYPADMCQWRAVSRLSRQLFGDVVLGAGYTPEEVALAQDPAAPIPAPTPAAPIPDPDALDDDVVDAEVVEEDTSAADDIRARATAARTVDALRELWKSAQDAGCLDEVRDVIESRVAALKAATPTPPPFEPPTEAAGDAEAGVAAVRAALAEAQK